MTFHHWLTNNISVMRHFSLNVNSFQRKTHYDCLGITPKATQNDIKSAYYKLSKQYHPDVNKGNLTAADKFRDITEAYEVLGNLKARKLYDRGLLVMTHEDYYTPDKPKAENFKHASFYHHRNQPTKSGSSNTVNYNLDEWTRLHYQDIFSAAKKKKDLHRMTVQDDKNNKEHREPTQMYVFFILVAAYGLLYVISSRNEFDVHDSRSSSDKPG